MEEIGFWQHPNDRVGIRVEQPVGRTWKEHLVEKGKELIKPNQEAH